MSNSGLLVSHSVNALPPAANFVSLDAKAHKKKPEVRTSHATFNLKTLSNKGHSHTNSRQTVQTLHTDEEQKSRRHDCTERHPVSNVIVDEPADGSIVSSEDR